MIMTTTQKSKPTSKNSIRWVVIGLLLIAAIGGGYWYLRIRSARQSPIAATSQNTLQTAKATLGNITLFASGTGTIQPAAESQLSFNANGQVTAINVKSGDQVKAGQVLAQLDDTDAKLNLDKVQAAMNQLTSAAAIANAEQALATAQMDYATARDALGFLISPEVLYWEENVAQRQQALADAQTAAQTDTSSAAKQKVDQAQAALDYAQNSLAHFQEIYKTDYIRENFTQSTSRVGRNAIIRTRVTKIQDPVTGEWNNLIYPPTEGEIGMARSAYDLAKASIGEAQTYVDVLKDGEIPEGATGSSLTTYIQTKHALETAEYNLKAMQLISPIDGTISSISIHAGDLVSKGNSVITVSNLDQPYQIDAYIDAKDWGQVQAGYEADVAFDIIPDQTFKGSVINVYPTLDTTSSNSALIHFIVRLDKTIAYNLPSGAAASVKVIGGNATNTVLVPLEALHVFGDGKYAVFVKTNGSLQLKIVDVGLKDLTKAQILSGIQAGDIVTTGVVKTK
jgi:HlyD family secretion protein